MGPRKGWQGGRRVDGGWKGTKVQYVQCVQYVMCKIEAKGKGEQCPLSSEGWWRGRRCLGGMGKAGSAADSVAG